MSITQKELENLTYAEEEIMLLDADMDTVPYPLYNSQHVATYSLSYTRGVSVVVCCTGNVRSCCTGHEILLSGMDEGCFDVSR